MDINYVEQMIDGYVEKLFEHDKYLAFINRNNKLNRFDLTEKLSILSQISDKASDVKTEVEWFMEGRRIISGAKPVYVMCNNIRSVYTDTETGDAIDSSINPAQLEVGIRHGVIEKTANIHGRILVAMYDITCTDIIPNISVDTDDGDDYFNKIFNIKDKLTEIFGVTFDISGEAGDENDFYYHKAGNTVIMSSLPVKLECKLLMELLAKLLVGMYMADFKSGEHLRFVTDSVVYSIITLRGEDTHDFNFRVNIDKVGLSKEELLETLEIIQKCVDYVRNNIIGDTDNASEKVYKIKVAEELKKVYQLIMVKDRSILRNT